VSLSAALLWDFPVKGALFYLKTKYFKIIKYFARKYVSVGAISVRETQTSPVEIF
jgi:hypothetical protein